MCHYGLSLGQIELKFSPDIIGLEGSTVQYVMLNPKTEQTDTEVARMAVELGYHVLRENGLSCSINDIEYIDLLTGRVVTRSRFRKGTLDRAEVTARIVDAVWDTL